MSQYIIIGGDGKEYGPVTTEEVAGWVSSGRANGDTRIKTETDSGWTRLSDLPELADVPRASSPTASEAMTGEEAPLQSDVLTRDHGVWSAGCLERGWQVFSDNLGGAIGTVAVLLTLFGVVFVLSLIPLVGILVNLAFMVVKPVLVGGLMYFFIKADRGQTAGVGDLFSGFSRNFGGLFLVNLVQGLIIFAAALPGVLIITFTIGLPILRWLAGLGEMIMESLTSGQKIFLPDFSGISIPLLLAGFVILILPMIYLSTCWAYAIPLAVDRRMRFWDAMQTSRKVVNKHWFMVFFFLTVIGVIAFSGVVVCGIGLFITIPLGMAMYAASYAHLFDER